MGDQRERLPQQRQGQGGAGVPLDRDVAGERAHHHGVGVDHAPWLSAEIGDLGVDVLRAIKAELDPVGILNPGKLSPRRPG
jgi:FAD/FMN-containing dehydrogenase